MAQPTPAGWYPDPTGKPGEMYWDGQQWHQDQTYAGPSALAPMPGTETIVASAQQPHPAYAYKTPVLYAFGGLFFPPLVYFLMGGDRKTCFWMLCMWPLFIFGIFLLFTGVFVYMALIIWSVIACYQEAVRQNRAHGFAS